LQRALSLLLEHDFAVAVPVTVMMAELFLHVGDDAGPCLFLFSAELGAITGSTNSGPISKILNLSPTLMPDDEPTLM
jgi:hypothetical protein